MTTHIGDLNNQTVPARERQQVSRTTTQDSAAVPGGPQRPSSATDEVQLSSTALKMQQIAQTLAEQPEIDQTRVEAIRSSIEQGTYQIDARRVADKLLAHEGLLGGAYA